MTNEVASSSSENVESIVFRADHSKFCSWVKEGLEVTSILISDEETGSSLCFVYVRSLPTSPSRSFDIRVAAVKDGSFLRPVGLFSSWVGVVARFVDVDTLCPIAFSQQISVNASNGSWMTRSPRPSKHDLSKPASSVVGSRIEDNDRLASSTVSASSSWEVLDS